MATKYYCDACGKEETSRDKMELVRRDYAYKGELMSLECDICQECSKKIFKSVKVYRSHIKVVLTYDE